MCGIVGVWQRDDVIDRAEIVAMRDTLAERGPDAGGLFVSGSGRVGFGFRRLSIIDLSEHSNQPLSDASGTSWIVFNGEVYNYRQIRTGLLERGHVFRSDGDAEVVLHAWLEYGPACLDMFHGMFAFAIWSESDGCLFIARDRLGIKPFYYYHDDAHLIFASQPKAILRHHSVRRAVDPDALRDYLTYGYVPHDRAIFAGMRKLPAGHCGVFDGRELQLRRYWSAEYRPVERSAGEVIDGLRQSLRDSVNMWMTSDVPVGMFLSGGLDSSAVCGLVSGTAGGPLRTYSIGFDYERQNELEYARTVAGAFSTEHHERIVTVDDARTVLSTLAGVYDEPLYDTSSVPTYYVSKFAREFGKVVLTGDGGDELLFGYHWYENFLRLSKSSWKNSAVAAAATNLAVRTLRGLPRAARISALTAHATDDPMRRYFGLIGFFDPWEQRRLLGVPSQNSVGDDPLWLYRKFYRRDLPDNVALRLLDINTFLTDDILPKVDRASMANSLEARTPMLEHSFVEYVMSVPELMIYQDSEKKYLLKKAMEGILPHDIIYRSKRGFSAPVRSWLKGDLQAYASDRLLNGHTVRDGLFRRRAIESMMKNYSRKRYAKLWQLLVFEEWYRRWISTTETA